MLTSKQIIDAVWELNTLDAIKIATVDDFIVMCKIFPYLLSGIVILMAIVFSEAIKDWFFSLFRENEEDG